MRTLLLLICVRLAVAFALPDLSAQEQTQPAEKANAPAQASASASSSISLASTNSQVLLDVIAREVKPLAAGPNDANIARLVARILEQMHFLGSQQPFDDKVSSKFLDRYIEVLDGLHMHLLQSDLAEFEPYRTTLDDLTYGRGDTKPARVIFARFLERLEQRAKYVAELLQTEKFEFTGNDRYNLNRKEAPRPKDLAEAKQIWRQHLRFEVLTEKLNKEKPDEIASKIARRYARIVRMYQDLDNGDIFEIYLSALTHVYDPHSDYMGKSQLDTFSINMSLSLFGIGALLQSEDGYCKIKELVAGGPAINSKELKPNDRIISVAQGDGDPVDVVDMPLKKVVDMIRGPKGTVVKLTIIPADAADPSNHKPVRLVRDEIKLEDQEAKAKIIDVPTDQDKTARLGVIDLPSFYASFNRKDTEPKSTTVDVSKLLRKLKREKVEGIILDLRKNGGGSLEEAINLTGLFIEDGPVVQVKDSRNNIAVDKDTDSSVLYDGPLIVLTSRYSASASEILAGALQDYGRALVVGDSSTHGKGTVQSLIMLDNWVPKKIENPGAVKLTIRKFYRPSGASTQLRGVVPDIVLPSPNNYADIGESALENAMPWDTIAGARYKSLNLISPVLPELQKRSSKRLDKDQDFVYAREDVEQYRKNIADKSVVLNEAQRLQEKQELEAKQKARQAELKSRPESNEKVFDITLKQAELPGLPPPEAKTNLLASAKGPHVTAGGSADASASVSVNTSASKPDESKRTDAASSDDDEDSSTEPKVPAVDANLKEAKRILVDLISLWPRVNSVATTN